MTPRVRVLVVDDSVVVRRILSDALTADPELEVVGAAASGRLALAKLERTPCDVVTLDVEMPDTDGLETLDAIRRQYPKVVVIMCSGLTARGAATTLDALARGASDYVAKPASSEGRHDLTPFLAELTGKVKALGRRSRPPGLFAGLGAPGTPAPPRTITRPGLGEGAAGPVSAVAIGVSTGGPNALAVLVPNLAVGLDVPIFIVQHMPALFTRMLAERLAVTSRMPVREARQGEAPEAGTVYIAPGNWHMRLAREGRRPVIALDQGAPENSCRPAVDVLFESVAAVYGAGTLGVVMTGMGKDGLRGAELIRAAGGRVLAQDEATSVVWGMPGYVAAAGLADDVLPLPELGAAIVRRVRARSISLRTPS